MAGPGAKASPLALDIYVGPLCRYYTSDWEPVRSRVGRDAGVAVLAGSVTDASPGRIAPSDEVVLETADAISEWQLELAYTLTRHGVIDFGWAEHRSLAYRVDRPDWDGWGALRLWAALLHEDSPAKPDRLPEDWQESPILATYANADAESAFPHLLQDISMWLPLEKDVILSGPAPDERVQAFGALGMLVDELEAINKISWQADDLTIARWIVAGLDTPPEDLGSLEAGGRTMPLLEDAAKFGFAVTYRLARIARRRWQPLVLHY